MRLIILIIVLILNDTELVSVVTIFVLILMVCTCTRQKMQLVLDHIFIFILIFVLIFIFNSWCCRLFFLHNFHYLHFHPIASGFLLFLYLNLQFILVLLFFCLHLYHHLYVYLTAAAGGWRCNLLNSSSVPATAPCLFLNRGDYQFIFVSLSIY